MRASLTSCVLVAYLMVGAGAFFSDVLPSSWRYQCLVKPDHEILQRYVDVSETDRVLHIHCHVNGDTASVLNFKLLRDHLRKKQNVLVFLQVTCSNGGKFSLPWPMKASGLVGLEVSNCVLTEKFSDFKNPEILEIPDFIRVIVIHDSTWLIEESTFDDITNPDSLLTLTSDYDCGQDETIEVMVTRNVSTNFIMKVRESTPATVEFTPTAAIFKTDKDAGTVKLQDSNSASDSSYKSSTHYSDVKKLGFDKILPTVPGVTDSTTGSNGTKSAENEYMKLLNNLLSLDLKCNFKKLRVIDESISYVTSVHHFQAMVSGALYPELSFMNYSMFGLRTLPPELQSFSMYFPKVEYIDLSKNYLTKVHLPLQPVPSRANYMTFNVRSNRIANITLDDVLAWAENKYVFIDIRNNPINCSCHMETLLQKIQSSSSFESELQKYSYLRDLECSSPAELKGQRLAEVKLQCSTARKINATRPMASASALGKKIIAILVAAVVAVVATLVVAVTVIVVRRYWPEKMRKFSPGKCVEPLSEEEVKNDMKEKV